MPALLHNLLKLVGGILLGLLSIIVIAILFTPLWGRFFWFYDYGVSKQREVLRIERALEYPTYYSVNRNKAYDFDTVLFTDRPVTDQRPSYSPNTIYITHMKNLRNGEHSSTIHFFETNYAAERFQLVADSVKLTHTTKDGVEIKPTRTQENTRVCGGKELCRCGSFFSLFYNDDQLPDEIIEKISFDLMVDGTLQRITKEFIIEKQPHYNYWDIISGI